VVQQNAALVEEAAAAAGSLQDQAAGLVQVVGVFKINATQATHSTRAMDMAPVASRPVAKTTSPKSKPKLAAISNKSAKVNKVAKSEHVAAKPATSNKSVAAPKNENDWEEF
jgi:methyl-accepting chemotaxis protein